MEKYLAECKTSEKASDADIINMNNKEQPPSKEEKCLLTCLLEKMEIVSWTLSLCATSRNKKNLLVKLKNNQVNKDGYLKLVGMIPGANEKIGQLVTEIVDECKPIEDADRLTVLILISNRRILIFFFFWKQMRIWRKSSGMFEGRCCQAWDSRSLILKCFFFFLNVVLNFDFIKIKYSDLKIIFFFKILRQLSSH